MDNDSLTVQLPQEPIATFAILWTDVGWEIVSTPVRPESADFTKEVGDTLLQILTEEFTE